MVKNAELVSKPEQFQFHKRQGLLCYASQSDLRSASPPRSLVSTSIYICVTLIGNVPTLTIAGKVFHHLTKIVKAWIYPEEYEG